MNQWRKEIVTWRCGRTLYLSVPFTWLLAEAEGIAKAHDGPVVAGGPAVALMGAPWAKTPDSCPFDVLAMHNPCATFTTRGCPNACPFCAVPKIEGGFRELSVWKPAPVVCDSNLLAASHQHFGRVMDSLMSFLCVDFNQGLDAQLFTAWHADQLCRLKRVKVRFSFDYMNAESRVADAIALARHRGLLDVSIYVLIGFRDTPEDAKARLDKVIEWGAIPCPMRYQPLDARQKNNFVAPAWSEHELQRMARYYWKYRFLKDIPYADYRRPDHNEMPLFDGAQAAGAV